MKGEDELYQENLLKYRRQRVKIMEFLEYVDAQKNELFRKNEIKLIEH